MNKMDLDKLKDGFATGVIVMAPDQARAQVVLRVVRRELQAYDWCGCSDWEDWCLSYMGMFHARVESAITGMGMQWGRSGQRQEALKELAQVLAGLTVVPLSHWQKLLGVDAA